MQIIIIYKPLNKYLQMSKIRNYKKLNQESWHTFSKKKKSQANFKHPLIESPFLYHFYTILNI